MTEKRYTTMWKPETTFSRFWIVRENWEGKLNANDVVDLLNEQHEQIERLKGNFRALDEVKCELADENEKLKQFKEKVFTLIDKEIARNEKAIEWGKETGADSGAMEFYNHMLKRLKKELKE